MPKISVIIPVHNVEKYLGECLDSILGQTLKDIEVICVDDGSTDGSAKILEEYAARDVRVKVLRQDRSGAGTARNKGLAEARGEYLFFCDADDWADAGMLSALYRRAEATGSDIVVAGANYDDEFLGEYRHVGIDRETQALPQPFPPAALGVRLFTALRIQAWNKLFRRQFVVDRGILFQGLPRVNDLAFVNTALATADRIATLDRAYYHYRKGHGGNLSSGVDDMPDMSARAWIRVRDELTSRGVFDQFRAAFSRAASQSLVDVAVSMHDAAALESFFKKAQAELIPALGL